MRTNSFVPWLSLLLAGCGPEVQPAGSSEAMGATSKPLHSDTARKDFNSDGYTDLLWYEASTGRVNTWLLNGVTVASNPDVSWRSAGSAGWVIKGTGDFNRDGFTDILWYQASSGRVNVWLLNGLTVVSNPDISWTVPGSAGWVIKGTGDFNADGYTDILWYQASTGRVNTWLLNGLTVAANPDISWTVPGSAGWEIKGTGDFNADGYTDILWYQASTGRVNTWLLNGVTVSSNPDISWRSPGSAGWEIKGTGDYNRDGSTDILWYQASTGRVNTWLLNGLTVSSNPDFSWRSVGSAGWEIMSR